MDRDEYKRAACETWETMAPGWDRWRDAIEATSVPIRDWMLRELAPTPGDTVLELASGFGDTSHAAAELVGEQRTRHLDGFQPDDGRQRAAPRRRARAHEPRVPDHGRREHRARGRLR